MPDDGELAIVLRGDLGAIPRFAADLAPQKTAFCSVQNHFVCNMAQHVIPPKPIGAMMRPTVPDDRAYRSIDHL